MLFETYLLSLEDIREGEVDPSECDAEGGDVHAEEVHEEGRVPRQEQVLEGLAEVDKRPGVGGYHVQFAPEPRVHTSEGEVYPATSVKVDVHELEHAHTN